jgi:hypothetical protein
MSSMRADRETSAAIRAHIGRVPRAASHLLASQSEMDTIMVNLSELPSTEKT